MSLVSLLLWGSTIHLRLFFIILKIIFTLRCSYFHNCLLFLGQKYLYMPGVSSRHLTLHYDMQVYHVIFSAPKNSVAQNLFKVESKFVPIASASTENSFTRNQNKTGNKSLLSGIWRFSTIQIQKC